MLTVAVGNVVPVVANPIADLYVPGGLTFSFTVPSNTFYDPDSTLVYSATGVPSGLTFNATTRTLSGRASGPNTVNTYPITVTATESPGGASASTTFVLEVVCDDSPPSLSPEEFMMGSPGSSTPAKQKFALSNSSTTHTATQVGHGVFGQSVQMTAPVEALSQSGTSALTPPQTQSTWYTYDRCGRCA